MQTSTQQSRPLVIGLTGGIGSGKTTVADGFAALGVPVIDADLIARELVEPGQPALDQIRTLFGAECLRADGRLDRTLVRRRIFADKSLRHRLEAILHPDIRNRINDLIAEVRTAYCIVVIPLLLETGQDDLIDRILVVDAPEEEQIKRVAARDKLSHNAVMTIMGTQADRQTRLAAADDIIANNSDLETLMSQIRSLHRRYLEISNDN
ncbi:MAG: dephospho-CoA kinase [Gammaproteobacteria bacterium]|jgi:dephospho-CoA kinase